MAFFVALYIITGIAFVVIPAIILYLKLKDKKNLSIFLLFFSTTTIYIIPFIVAINGVSAINDKEFFIGLIWATFIIIIILGLVSGIMYYCIIKKYLNKVSEILSFIYSLGITGGYAFYFYIFYGIILKTLIAIIIDEENEDKNSKGYIYMKMIFLI